MTKGFECSTRELGLIPPCCGRGNPLHVHEHSARFQGPSDESGHAVYQQMFLEDICQNLVLQNKTISWRGKTS